MTHQRRTGYTPESDGRGAALTLADVATRLASCPLPASRLRDLRSAISRISALAGREPRGMPAQPSALRPILAALKPGRARISAARWCVLRSDLAGALATAGDAPFLRTAGIRVGPEWEELRAAVGDQHMRDALSRFSGWCSLRGIGPSHVDLPAFDRFEAELTTMTIIPAPRHARTAAQKVWNRLAKDLASHGVAPLPAAGRTRPVSRASCLDRLAASFNDDLARYLASLSGDDPFADRARDLPLSAFSIRQQRQCLIAATADLLEAGMNPEALTGLGDLCSPEAFRMLFR